MPGYRYGTHSYTKSAVDPLSKRWCSRLHCLHNTGRSSKKCLAHTHAPHRRTGTAHPTQPAQPPIPFPPLAACYYYLLTACPAEARRLRLAAALEEAKDGTLVKEAGGYKLFLSRKNPTGYVGVQKQAYGRFQAKYYDGASDDNNHVSLGRFNTAIEAAVAYAKYRAEAGPRTGRSGFQTET